MLQRGDVLQERIVKTVALNICEGASVVSEAAESATVQRAHQSLSSSWRAPGSTLSQEKKDTAGRNLRVPVLDLAETLVMLRESGATTAAEVASAAQCLPIADFPTVFDRWRLFDCVFDVLAWGSRRPSGGPLRGCARPPMADSGAGEGELDGE